MKTKLDQVRQLVTMYSAVLQSRQAGLAAVITRMDKLRLQLRDLEQPRTSDPASPATKGGADVRWETWVEERRKLINTELIEAALQREEIRADVAQALARREAAQKLLDRSVQQDAAQTDRRASW